MRSLQVVPIIVLFFSTLSATRLHGQNVGIGTLSPINRLDIFDPGSADSMNVMLGLISPVSKRPAILFSEFNQGVPGSGMTIEYDGFSGTGDGNRLHINSVTNSIPRFTFVANGRLGIGETEPTEPLEVGGSGRVFFGDGEGPDRTGLLIDGNEPGDYTRIHSYDYSNNRDMDLWIASPIGVKIQNPDSSAILHLNSNDRGLLIPRMTEFDRNAISDPAEGLLVYQTNAEKGIYMHKDMHWYNISRSNNLVDKDNDTGVDVEAFPDNDQIQFNVGGELRWSMREKALYAFNPGSSVFIGHSAGMLDDNSFKLGVAIGTEALKVNTSGIGNTAVGGWALRSNDTADYNTAVGYLAMFNNLSGRFNTALGAYALYDNTTGIFNTALGAQSLQNNVEGTRNTAIGMGASAGNVNGGQNCALGFGALGASTNGSNNVAIGYLASSDNISAFNTTAVGYHALRVNQASGNVAVGSGALSSNESALYNTAVGTNALESSNATRNSALGYWSLRSNTTGWGNTSVGSRSMVSNISGSINTALGDSTLALNESGIGNVAIGYSALRRNIEGIDNVAIGSEALANATGDLNVGVGRATLYSLDGGSGNTAVGTDAGTLNETGNNTTALGYRALENNQSSELTAVGAFALQVNSIGTRNTAVGFEGLKSNLIGFENTAVGYRSLRVNSNGDRNSAFGEEALRSNTDGNNNIAVGVNSLFNNSIGNFNVAIGNFALDSDTSPEGLVAIGYQSLQANTSGIENVAIGYNSLLNSIDGDGNTAVGYEALLNNDDADFNTAIGRNALYENTEGDFNTGLGYSAGDSVATNIYSTFVGALSDCTPEFFNEVYYSTAIGYDSRVFTDNQVRLGSSNTTSIGGIVDFEIISDARFKRDLDDDVPGLEFIELLTPVTYTVDIDGMSRHLRESDRNKKVRGLDPRQVVYSGFVAQDVHSAAQTVGYKFSGVVEPSSSNGLYGLRYATFVVPLVKATQELSEENELLRQELAQLRALNAELRTSVDDITTALKANGILLGN